MGKALSNRQRRALRKATPAQPKAPAAAAPQMEPRGVAAREAVRDQLAHRLLTQKGADLAVAVAIGNMTPAQARAEVGVEVQVEALPGQHVRHGLPLRAAGRDGLLSLHQSGSLTDRQFMAGMAYRQCFEAAQGGLGSCLASAGGVGGSRQARDVMAGRDPAELRRAYLVARLGQMERLAAGQDASGRTVQVLRLVAGQGETVATLGKGSGHARDGWRAALVDALELIADLLRITGR